MPNIRRGIIRYLISLLFGLAGGILGIWLSMLVMMQVAIEAEKAGTDKTGMGGSYALWLLTAPLQFLAGAAIGVMCVDGLYKLSSPTKDRASENTDKTEGQEPVSPQHAESCENEPPSDFWPIQWYRRWNSFTPISFRIWRTPDNPLPARSTFRNLPAPNQTIPRRISDIGEQELHGETPVHFDLS